MIEPGYHSALVAFAIIVATLVWRRSCARCRASRSVRAKSSLHDEENRYRLLATSTTDVIVRHDQTWIGAVRLAVRRNAGRSDRPMRCLATAFSIAFTLLIDRHTSLRSPTPQASMRNGWLNSAFVETASLGALYSFCGSKCAAGRATLLEEFVEH